MLGQRSGKSLGFNMLSTSYYFFMVTSKHFHLPHSPHVLHERCRALNAEKRCEKKTGTNLIQGKQMSVCAHRCPACVVLWRHFYCEQMRFEKKGVIKILRFWRNILYLWKGHVTMKISERLRTDVRFMKGEKQHQFCLFEKTEIRDFIYKN